MSHIILCVASIGWMCFDEGALSRRELCWTGGEWNGKCKSIPEELWKGSLDRTPSWASYGLPFTSVLQSTTGRKLFQLSNGQQIVSTTLQVPICGDGELSPDTEECDDGNTIKGDGCSATCKGEAGWRCYPSVINNKLYMDPVKELLESSVCEENGCGDGKKHITEQCDDGNRDAGDGCTPQCQIEDNYHCVVKNSKSVCTPPKCGDSKKASSEECDDGNIAPGDGCDSDCKLETILPYLCTNGCETNCHRYENQQKTVCVPQVQTDPPSSPPIFVTKTETFYETSTETISKSYQETTEAVLTWEASTMNNIDSPCGRFLNGKVGCCSHLSEDNFLGYSGSSAEHPYGLLDMVLCKWPKTGYVRVTSATCESLGHQTIRDESECVTAATYLGLSDTTISQTANISHLHKNVLEVTIDKLALSKLLFLELPPAGQEIEVRYLYEDGINRFSEKPLSTPPGVSPASSYIKYEKNIITETYHWAYYKSTEEIDWTYNSSVLVTSDWVPSDRSKKVHLRWFEMTPSPESSQTSIYMTVKAVGTQLPGCSYNDYEIAGGMKRLKFSPPKPFAPQQARCSKDKDSCLCRVDPYGVNLQQYDPSIDISCSFLLHQLHCGYNCLASYQSEYELAGCRVNDDCPLGSFCNIPKSKHSAVAQKEFELQAALEKEQNLVSVTRVCFSGFGSVCPKTAAELRLELDVLIDNLDGWCSGTGRKQPVCDTWLEKVYKRCRHQPVIFFNRTHELEIPLPHCQPLWWKYRTYEHFKKAFRVSKLGESCWSGSAMIETVPSLVAIALFVILLT